VHSPLPHPSTRHSFVIALAVLAAGFVFASALYQGLLAAASYPGLTHEQMNWRRSIEPLSPRAK